MKYLLPILLLFLVQGSFAQKNVPAKLELKTLEDPIDSIATKTYSTENIIISGTIIDLKTNSPIKYANVEVIIGWDTTIEHTLSDKNGNYSLTINRSYIPARLRVISSGKKTYIVDNVAPKKGNSVIVNFSMEPRIQYYEGLEIINY